LSVAVGSECARTLIDKNVKNKPKTDLKASRISCDKVSALRIAYLWTVVMLMRN